MTDIEGKIGLDVKDAVSGIKAINAGIEGLGKSLSGLTAQLDDILKQFDGLASKAKNVTNIKIPKSKYTVTSEQGTISSNSRTKNIKNYEEEIIKLKKEEVEAQKAITEDVKARARNRDKMANAKVTFASGFALAASKKQDQNSAEYLSFQKARTDALNESKNWRAYREKHPELFVGGGFSRGWRNQLSNALSYMGGQADRMGLPGQLAGGILKIVGGAIKSPATAFATSLSVASKAVTDFGQATLKAYSEIESIKTQLGVVFSSQTQADSTFGKIAQYATHSPFGVQQTSELAILLKQSGVYASDLMDTMKMLGDTAGGNMEKMKRIANNYAQIVSIGKASMLDMRQFAYAGIPIFQAVSEELGVSQQHLRKMISEGKVTSDIIEKVFKNLTGINGIFENATEKGAKTLKARIQNLSDAKQLMYGSVGEWGVKFGQATGEDSFAIRVVSGLENIYSYLQDSVNTKNIQNDVKTIAARNSRINDLTRAKQYAENIGDKETAEILGKAIEKELNKRDVEKERNAYALSYDTKTGKDFEDKYGSKTIEMLEEEINNYLSKRKEALNKAGELSQSVRSNLIKGNFEKAREIGSEEYIQKAIANEYEAIIKELKDYKTVLGKVILEEEKRAAVERRVEELQNKYYDTASNASNQDTAFSKLFSNLQEMYESSDEYKEEQEKKKLALLEDAKKVLEQLLKYQDENGNIDITQLDYKTFSDYLGKRILDEGRKLLTAPSNSESAMTADRKVLEAQYETTLKKIYPELYKQQRYDEVALMQQALKDNPLTGTNKEYFANFSQAFDTQTRILQTLVDNSYGEEQKKYKSMLDALIGSTFQYGAPSANGLNADLTANGKGKYDTVPLWKRILAQYTGLTTQEMTSTRKTLENYRDDMSIRNMTAGVLSSTFKSMGVEAAQSLVKTSQTKIGDTWQVDWKKTEEAVRKFANSLSVSTDVIDAYSKGLEDTLSVYESLIAAGYTQAESQDLKNQKFVSTSTLKKLATAEGSQLVNAFGENLFTKDGLKVDFNGIDFIDEQGNRIAEEELVMTGNLFDLIKEELPKLREKLAEAEVTKAKNTYLQEMFRDVLPVQFTNKLLESRGLNSTTRFLANDPSRWGSSLVAEMQTMLADDQKLTSSKRHYKNIKNLTPNDILYLSMTTPTNESTEEDKKEIAEATKLVDEAMKKLEAVLDSFANGGDVKNLAYLVSQKEKQTALNEALLDLSEYRGVKDVTKGKPAFENNRAFNASFVKDVLGFDLKYDQTDILASMAKVGAQQGLSSNIFGLNVKTAEGKNRFEGMTDDKIVEDLEKAEKSMLMLQVSAAETEKVFESLGTSIKNLAGELGKKTFVSVFENFGDAVAEGAFNADKMGDSMKDLAQEATLALAPIIQQAGFELVARGAMLGSPGMIAGGLALAATGGFASGLLKNLFAKSEDNDDDKTDKLESLKDDLVKILQQARSDSLYYENNLRHKTALGINEQFSHRAVHDAIISPSGDVITTDPRDYLIATKTPEQLGAGGVVVRPVINNKVINNTSANVRQEETANPDGSIDIVTIIEEVAGNYIASSKSDSAFEVRANRQRGRQYVM